MFYFYFLVCLNQQKQLPYFVKVLTLELKLKIEHAKTYLFPTEIQNIKKRTK